MGKENGWSEWRREVEGSERAEDQWEAKIRKEWRWRRGERGGGFRKGEEKERKRRKWKE